MMGQQKDFQKLYARITVMGKRVDISLNRRIREEDWDQGASRPKGRSKSAVELEKFILTVEEKFYIVERELFDKNIPVTAESLVNLFNEMVTGKKVESKTLGMVFDLHNARILELHLKGEVVRPTVSRYVTTKNYLVEFLQEKYKREDIQLADLKYSFVIEFDHWIRTKKNCAHNTTVKYIKNLRKIIKMAIDYNWLEKDPFVAFKNKAKHVNRECLDIDDLKRIEELDFEMPRLNNVRRLFLFSCYTGLAYSDIMSLKKEHISLDSNGDKWIIKERKKTRVVSRIPLLEKADEIMNSYIGHPKALREGTIFPSMTNQRLNAYLKEISDLAKITKTLTFHIARHTFATTVTLANGVSLEAVSAILGHTNTKQTQHYAKMVNSRIKREMDIVRDILNEK
jgi:site-specific recombinase XerD